MEINAKNIIQDIKNILKNFLFFIGFIVLGVTFSIIDPRISLCFFVLVLALSSILFFKPGIMKTPTWWGRLTAAIAMVFSLSLTFSYYGMSVNYLQEKDKNKMDALKKNNPREYLELLKSSPENQDKYLAEFKVMYPQEYQAEVNRVKKQEEDRKKKIFEDLKTQLLNQKSMSNEQKLNLYQQLVSHDPENKIYAKEHMKYKKIVAEQNRRELAAKMQFEEANEARENPEKFINLVDFTWSKVGFGTVMEASFVIRNVSPISIKDIVIVCEHSGASGTIIDRSKQVIYDVVKAKSKRTFKDVNMGFVDSQVKKTACYIDDAKVF